MDRLGVPALARLLSVSVSEARRLIGEPGFPDVDGEADGQKFWDETRVLRWAAGQGGALAEQAPLLYRPSSGSPAPYLGAAVDGRDVVMAWDTEVGKLGFVYTTADPYSTAAMRSAQARLIDVSEAAVLVGVHGGEWNGLHAPELRAVDAARPDRPYLPQWMDVQRLLGTPVPYWIHGLAHPQDITAWKPGDPVLTTHAIRSSLDTGPLLRLHSREEDGSTAGQAALALAREVDQKYTKEVCGEIESLDRAFDRAAIHLVAITAPPPQTTTPDEVVLRDGWAQILSRRDHLAHQCVEVARMWDGGKFFPYTTVAELRPDRCVYSAEFIARLQPAVPTVGHTICRTPATRTWNDPATDAPAAAGLGELVYAAIPLRLPTTSQLSQVILHRRQVWVRTGDGTLYLAPAHAGNGILWGYSGGGPRTLAQLLHRLLDDITAPAPRTSDPDDDVPRGLTDLIIHTPRDAGAVYSRADLVAACRGA
ncbi:hypothetical protein GCM10022221_22240 [Actinocorallia aurea]